MHRLWIGFFLVFSLSGAGCTSFRHPVKSLFKSTITGSTTTVSGEPAKPAEVTTARAETKVPLPPGTTFTFDDKLGTFTLLLPQASTLTATRLAETYHSPTAPVPPTAQDEADARAHLWTTILYRVGIFVGGAASIFGLLKDWPLVLLGGLCVLGASLFGLFIVSSPWLLVLFGIGISLKVVGPVLWHTQLKATQTQPNPNVQ